MRKVIEFPKGEIKGTLPSQGQKCGLCAKQGNLVKTDCCDNWICNDVHKMKSESCYLKHASYTVCAAHHSSDHKGKWQECKKCEKSWDMANYVWYATNENNFETLANPPEVPETRCIGCKVLLDLEYDCIVGTKDGKMCLECSMID
jgi:hypothetical protein